MCLLAGYGVLQKWCQYFWDMDTWATSSFSYCIQCLAVLNRDIWIICFIDKFGTTGDYPHKGHVMWKVLAWYFIFMLSWWRHQMETLYIYISPVNSPHKGQWRGALMFSFICAWINGWVNNREADDLRRHRRHYDVTIMILNAALDNFDFKGQAFIHLHEAAARHCNRNLIKKWNRYICCHGNLRTRTSLV